MEKIIKKRNIIKTIEEEIDTEMYCTKDGMIFDTEKESLEHEEKLDFLTYFNDKYKIKDIDTQLYGLNYGHVSYCHIVYIEKITDKVVDDFIRFYELKDHPEDLMKIKEGWSFVMLINDVNLWVFDKSDRLFVIETIDYVINKKKEELSLLYDLVN